MNTKRSRTKGVVGRLFALCSAKRFLVSGCLAAGGFFGLIAVAESADKSTCSQLNRAQLRGLQPLSVKTVVDGDTLRLQGGQLVRFIGVNTPEIDHENGNSQPLAEAARSYLQQKLKSLGNHVVLLDGQQAFDRYQRRLAHVYTVDGQSLEYALLEQGYGFHIAVPPNLANLACYAQAQRRAQQANKGVWGHAFYQARDVSTLTPKDTGFARIRARIAHVGRSKHNIWLNLVPASGAAVTKVTIQIGRKDLVNFKVKDWVALKGRSLSANGWLSWRRQRRELVMRVQHPVALHIDH